MSPVRNSLRIAQSFDFVSSAQERRNAFRRVDRVRTEQRKIERREADTRRGR